MSDRTERDVSRPQLLQSEESQRTSQPQQTAPETGVHPIVIKIADMSITGMRSCMPPTSGFGSPTIIAADRISSPANRANSQMPANANGSKSFRRKR